MRKPHLIAFTSEEERTEVRMDLTPEEVQFLALVQKKVNAKAKWTVDVRMSLSEVMPITEGVSLAHHPESACEGQACCIHNPSDHLMTSFPLLWREDRGLMERVCSHGCGHPDPDDLAYKKRSMTPEQYENGAWGVHGCCGCCRAEGLDGAA